MCSIQAFEENVKEGFACISRLILPLERGTPLRANDNTDELTAFSAFFDGTYHVSDTLDIYGGYRWTYEEVDVSYNSPTYLVLDSAGRFRVRSREQRCQLHGSCPPRCGYTTSARPILITLTGLLAWVHPGSSWTVPVCMPR